MKGWDVINSLSERVLQRKCFLGRHTEAIVSITELGKYRHSHGEQQSEGRMGTCTCALPIYFMSQLPQSPLIGMGSLEILVKWLLHTQLGKTRVLSASPGHSDVRWSLFIATPIIKHFSCTRLLPLSFVDSCFWELQHALKAILLLTVGMKIPTQVYETHDCSGIN